MEEMARVLAGSSTVRVPMVHKELCTRRLLVQEQFIGFTVADTEQLEASSVDRTALAEELLRCTLHQVLRVGFFHADPHPGNIFVLSDGSLGLIDFGAVGRLDSIQKAAMVDIMLAIAQRDASLLREGIERVTDLSDSASPEQLERTLARLMADHVRPTGAVDPAVLQDLVVALSRFQVSLPADLVILARTLATLDGTLRAISTDVAFVPAATAMMESKEAPVLDQQAMLRDELLAMLPHLRRLPERVDRLLNLAGRGELRVRSIVDEDSRRILRTLVNRGLLAAVGTVFLVVSAMLIVATIQVRSSARTSACSRSSASADCSPAPCSCSASWPPSPGTARHEHDLDTVDRRSARAALVDRVRRPLCRASVRRAPRRRALLPPSGRRRPAGRLGGRDRRRRPLRPDRHRHECRGHHGPRAGGGAPPRRFASSCWRSPRSPSSSLRSASSPSWSSSAGGAASASSCSGPLQEQRS